MTSAKKRLDHVLVELDSLGTEPDEETSRNIIAELSVINSVYRDSERVPMCCFRYDADRRIVCDVAGPLELPEFMEKCRQCQAQIKHTLKHLKTT